MADETKITPPPEVINGVIKLRNKTTSTNIQSIAKDIPDITQTPSSNQYGGFVEFFDDTSHLIGRVYAVKDTYDAQGVFLQAWNSTRTANGGIGVVVNEGTGQVSTIVSQPSANSNTQEIATTSWVRNLINTSSDTVVETYNDGTTFYRVWRSGWLEQGGRLGSINPTSKVTITLLKPFANTNYIGLCTPQITTSDRGDKRENWGFYIDSTTSCTMFNNSETKSVPYSWYVCGQGA